MALTPSEIETFVRDGVVHLPGAVPQEVALACRDELWRASGCEPDDPATWTEPVVRIPSMSTPPFVAAARAQPLEEAYDQLVGPGGWRPTAGLGTFPLRFPSPEDPGDTGWHVEASFAGDDGQMRVSLRSRGRALPRSSSSRRSGSRMPRRGYVWGPTGTYRPCCATPTTRVWSG